MRFAPPSWHVGKRGATRIIYAVVPTVANAYFLIAHGKNEQGELEGAEKKACRELMIEIKRYLGVRL